MDQKIWAGVGAGLAAGFLLGYFIGRGHSSSAPAPLAAPPTAAQQQVSPELALQRHIFDAKQAVTQEPKNPQVWIALGNAFFDAHKPKEAIEAYGKALELDPKNPNVLTDQGVMHRELKAYDKAIACFQKANALDSKHLQSLFNLGVVYGHDLKDKAKALKAWNRVIELDPTGPLAAECRKGIEELNTILP